MAVRAEFERSSYANVGRANYDLAEASMIAYESSKKTVARWVGCDPVEVIYTYSATYALNIFALALEQNGIVAQYLKPKIGFHRGDDGWEIQAFYRLS